MTVLEKFCTANYCYRYNVPMQPKGIVLHSTGVNQKNLDVYYKLWNKASAKVLVHAMVGMNGNALSVYQFLPWQVQCWGCGSGSKGSYNTSHIQIEIAEDALTDKTYYTKAFDMAAQLCAQLCEQYGWSADKIVSHHEACLMGYAFPHADCDHWLRRYGETMDDFRTHVNVYLRKPGSDETAKGGETVKVKPTVGDTVNFSGTKHYTSANALVGKTCKPGKATILRYYEGKHPYLVRYAGDGCTANGWVDASDIGAAAAMSETLTKTYTVRKGDTLSKIAAEYLGSWRRYPEIRTINGLPSNAIYVGQVLKLPG